jgi:hypothetical protein
MHTRPSLASCVADELPKPDCYCSRGERDGSLSAARLRDLHDEIVERAFELDRLGRPDAADELTRIARQLRDLIDPPASEQVE